MAATDLAAKGSIAAELPSELVITRIFDGRARSLGGLDRPTASRSLVGPERLHTPGLQSRSSPGRELSLQALGALSPITAAAALILVEECRLRLGDPVDEFIPELAGDTSEAEGQGS